MVSVLLLAMLAAGPQGLAGGTASAILKQTQPGEMQLTALYHGVNPAAMKEPQSVESLNPIPETQWVVDMYCTLQ